MNHQAPIIGRQTLRTLTLALASLALMATFGVTTASAQTTQLDMNSRFKFLDVSKERGVLVIDYKISKRSWRNMRQANIEPRLNLRLPNAKKTRYVFAYSTKLKSRAGRITYPKMNLRGFATAELRIIGYEGAYRVVSTSYGQAKGKRIRVPMRRVRRHQHVHHHPPVHNPPVTRPPATRPPTRPPVTRPANWRAQAINACKAQTRYSSEFNACVARAVKLKSNDAALVVNACGNASRYASGLNRCLDIALTMPGRRIDTISACGGATKYDSELNSCLADTKKYNYTAATVVKACDAQTRYASELSSCLRHARSLRANHAAATVNACGKATRSATAMNSCIKNAPALGRNRYGIIEACGNSTRYDSAFATCVSRATTPQRTQPRVRRASHRI